MDFFCAQAHLLFFLSVVYEVVLCRYHLYWQENQKPYWHLLNRRLHNSQTKEGVRNWWCDLLSG